MHILLIHQYFLEEDDPGGSRFNEMTRFWKEQGHDITVISGMVHYATGKKRPKHKGKFIVKENYSNNITVYRCHVSESYNSNFIGRLWGYFSFVFSSIICGLFYARKKYDLVLVSSPPLFVGITGLVLSKIKRIPFVFEIRDLWPESAIDTGVLTNKTIIRLAYWFEKTVYKNARLINTLTPAFQKKLIEDKKVPAEKVIMIPNAADFSIAEKVAAQFDVAAFRKENGWDGKFVITYVGAHGVANHLIQMVEAATLLKERQDILFLLIGDGMQRELLIQEAQKRSLSNIRFLKSVPKADVFKYILASDMGASVLKNVETFKTVYSNKTFDYMSCKKPVLMAIDGVSRELVEVADCGVFVEPENARQIAEVVTLYCGNPEKVKTQGMNGYNYARQYFDRNFLALTYLKELEKLKK
ncbi:MAG TPA: glycosyltransferase family 4 protein [Cytophagaceae bacterium]